MTESASAMTEKASSDDRIWPIASAIMQLPTTRFTTRMKDMTPETEEPTTLLDIQRGVSDELSTFTYRRRIVHSAQGPRHVHLLDLGLDLLPDLADRDGVSSPRHLVRRRRGRWRQLQVIRVERRQLAVRHTVSGQVRRADHSSVYLGRAMLEKRPS
jgi:hypothetical protein